MFHDAWTGNGWLGVAGAAQFSLLRDARLTALQTGTKVQRSIAEVLRAQVFSSLDLVARSCEPRVRKYFEDDNASSLGPNLLRVLLLFLSNVLMRS